jgi:aminoglycoside 2'-N-acetyltransferase I
VIRLVPSDALRPDEVAALRELFDEAWRDDAEGFTDQDWSHAVGGVHVIAAAEGAWWRTRPLSNGSCRPAAVACGPGTSRPSRRARAISRQGLGSLVIGEVGELIDRTYPLGALATGVVGFYERLGWVAWEGPTSVRTAAGRFERRPRTGTSSCV